nr:hypothetical protein [Moritella viscosa]SHO12216.1 Putative uncharacterized protein [Moritella viscosa]
MDELTRLRGRKRTAIPIKKKIKEAEVIAFKFKDMVIRTPTGEVCHLNRFRYIGCPILRIINSKPEALTLAGRDELVRHLYHLAVNVQTITTVSCLNNLLAYVVYIDSIDFQDDIFDLKIMTKCLKHFNAQALKGLENTKAQNIHAGLSWYLNKVNRGLDVKAFPKVKASAPSTKNRALDVESQLRPVGRTLLRGFTGFTNAINNNEWLEVHPMFDEVLFKEQFKISNWRGTGGNERNLFKRVMRIHHDSEALRSLVPVELIRLKVLYNHASRNALYLFYMFTGMNPSVLTPIKRSDVKFKDIGNGRYVFEGEKKRANYKGVDNSLGFSTYAKRVIESWLETSEVMFERLGIKGIKGIKDKPLLPYFDMQGGVKDFSYIGTGPNNINKLIEKLHGFRVNSRIFRNTKADLLMRVTEDVYIVAQGLNNTISVVERKYSSGVDSDHEKSIHATMCTQVAIAKGRVISEAVKEAKVLHSDVLSDYEYKERLRQENIKPATVTPTGVRCQGPTDNKLEAELGKLKRAGINFDDDESKCTDFIGCLDCEKHLLVASTNDIWLMLSFSELIAEVFGHIAQNSAPKLQVFKVKTILDRTLKRLKDKSPRNHKEAESRILNGDLHPLYADRYSLKHFFGE